MGHVHRYLPQGDDIEGGRLAEIETAISSWRANGRGDENDLTFLSQSRTAYTTSAPTWPYLQRNYGLILDEARLPFMTSPFANVAVRRGP